MLKTNRIFKFTLARTMSTSCKRIAMYMDGTWNTPQSDTNVHRLYEKTVTSKEQLPIYFQGVGTSWGDYFTGGLFARGMTDIIRDVYDRLVQEYNKDDHIFLFGFSRGAFEVRALLGFLDTCGLRTSGSPVTAKQLWDQYEAVNKNPEKTRTLDRLLALSDAEKDKLKGIEKLMVDHCQPIKVHFVGVFDVVAADPQSDQHRYGQNPTKFGRIAHAMSIDEHRGAFQVMYCEEPPQQFIRDIPIGSISQLPREPIANSKPDDEQKADKQAVHFVEQRWFPGVHSNIGGGFSETDVLSKIPLRWMQQCAIKEGLQFFEEFKLDGNEHVLNKNQMDIDWKQWVMKLGHNHYRPMNTDTSVNETIDKSVFERYQNKDMNYKPENLKKWAASLNINLDTFTPADVWAETGHPRWFIGVHSHVGGCMAESDMLSKITPHWIQQRAAKSGLECKRFIHLDGTEHLPNRNQADFDLGTWLLHFLGFQYRDSDFSVNETIDKLFLNGVGMKPGERVLGALFAYGITDIIQKAYRFLSDNYNKGDEIYLFGFSRGAYEIRLLIAFLQTCGLRKEICPVSIQQLWDYFETTHSDKRKPTRDQLETWKNEHNYEPEGIEKYLLDYCQPVNIKFVGIFDAVAADLHTERYKFGQDPRKIGRVAHALALDERRGFFPAMLFEEPLPSQDKRELKDFIIVNVCDCEEDEEIKKCDKKSVHLIEQRWFVGVHSHVGGGKSETDILSKIPLHWIQQRAAKAGLVFKRHIHLEGNEHLHCASQMNIDMEQKLLQKLSLKDREIGYVASLNETIDKTVFERYQKKELEYRPANLKAWAERKDINLNLAIDPPYTRWADTGKVLLHKCHEVTQTSKSQYVCQDDEDEQSTNVKKSLDNPFEMKKVLISMTPNVIIVVKDHDSRNTISFKAFRKRASMDNTESTDTKDLYLPTMPLSPQYEWSQDESTIKLDIPLKNASRKDVDFYVADLIIKVNFKPYVLLVDLIDSIVPDTTLIKIINGVMHLCVNKAQNGLWKELIFHGTKNDILERRKASMARKTLAEQQLAEKRKETKYATEKKTLRDQMALDEHERQRLDDLKANEKQREEEAMYRSFQELQTSTKAPQRLINPPKQVKYEMNTIIEDDPSFDTESEDEFKDEPEEDESFQVSNNTTEEVIYIPAPRESQQSKISFTPRVFPTPSRESTAADEEDWLMKNRKHLKNHKGLNYNSVQDISETDPVWLKAKADEFYHHRDFLSARNAYTEALSIDSTMTAYKYIDTKYSYIYLCADDCSTALAQLPDNGETSADPGAIHRLKVRALIRRGTAYAQLGMYSQAKADYGVALTMHPENVDLQLDFARITQLDECYRIKQQADAAFAQQDFKVTKELYTNALQVDNTFVACLSNRAACSLALLDAPSCIEDCSQALNLLEEAPKDGPITLSAIPLPGTSKRKAWVLKTLVRRGTAYVSLKLYKEAEADFRDALVLDPDNNKLQQDLNCIQDFLKFSRGAFEVRKLIRFLHTCGLRMNDKVSTSRLWEYFKERHKPDRDLISFDELVRDTSKIQHGYEVIQNDMLLNCQQINIVFVGFFDTIAADCKAFECMYGQNQDQIKNIFHAMALDEQCGFSPDMPITKPNYIRKTSEKVKQRWFIGAHSNVGGGFSKNDVLARIPLHWMQNEAAKVGLEQNVIQLEGHEHLESNSQLSLDWIQWTLSKLPNTLKGYVEAETGALLANRMTDIIRYACKFLVNDYNPDDKVYLFGFSRGTFEVRVLIGFLHTCSLRDDISPVSNFTAMELFRSHSCGQQTKVG
ncbi:hypothetical protein THRCLA_03994 [Thraustotheca clavata]|uniref:CS domain-containing protein n=1 Tax=Thraustotheca clavata TaxID=74557 RepID=A0A1W0A093_9STRA|nr:hypothetical protein THRCLA_03994 [Thraustotheca clavata]